MEAEKLREVERLVDDLEYAAIAVTSGHRPVQHATAARSALLSAIRGMAAGEGGEPSDTEMLDWLEAQSNGMGWMARKSSTGRGYRLHNDPDGEHATARSAIKSAMKKGG